MTVLTEAEQRQFMDEGFLTLDVGVDDAALDRIIADLADQYPPMSGNDPATQNTRIQDAWKTNRDVHAVAAAPRVLGALRELYHREPRPFQTLNFPVGTSQPAHSDTLHFNSLPHSYMCGAWVALEDIDDTNGPVYYYPKSHMLPEFNMSDVGVDVGKENYYEYELFIDQAIKEFGLEPRLATIPKGHAVIWAANLIHGGAPRKDIARSRHTQVTHYFFEGCRYYTPMYSRGFKVEWREPEWIPTDLSGSDPS